ncbi:serine/threonine protein kinase [Prevotella sp.]|uniref:serine/threonine protein kinase n=1 Tax=Prevotella sp. TaxID=59823 RepID=UPI003077F881
MIEYFYPNQELILPELAGHLDIGSDKFIVVQRFDGGMGTCYRIVDAQGTSYALKVIHSDLLLDEKSIYRYNEELKLWLTFSACDGVAEAKSIIKINEIPCVVSSWMENGDMSTLITDMNPRTFYTSMDRIITALKWVYDNYKVIHRDLKPGNILIDKDNKAYVADWGLAKLISASEQGKKNDSRELAGITPYLTQQGTFVGTVLYASPEQLLGLPNIDFRSDIYSLGCIMYQWETGKPPFVAKTIQEIASGHLYTKPSKIG